MATMIEDRSVEFVAGWSLYIAGGLRCDVQYVTNAVTEVTGIEADWMAAARGEMQTAVGSLTPEQSQQVIRLVEDRLEAISRHERSHCHFCGLPLGRDGECRECR